MSKSISDYLPSKIRPEKGLIQGRVDSQIINEVKRIMAQDRLSWSDILTACMKQFLDEKRKPKMR